MKTTKRRDLTQGPVGKSLLLFVLPIMLGNVLQTLYSAADKMVVGQFAENGDLALAAVGGTTSVSYLIIGLFIGLGMGVNVICANLMGAKKFTELRRTMHTALPVALVCGIVVAITGILVAEKVLLLMDTPKSVLGLATLYMRIYFASIPAVLLYNFGAAILRSNGDTKRPMYILMFSGILNVVLNLVFVIGFHMSVDGVALATAIAQVCSAVVVLWILFNPKDQYKMQFRELRVHGKELLAIIRIGVPSGLSGMVFSLSKVVLQSTLNGFEDAELLAGQSIVADVGGIIYQVLAAMLAACVSFAGQCYGAKKYKRIDQLVVWGCVICWAIMGSMIAICAIFAEQTVGLFNKDPDVVAWGSMLIRLELTGYVIYIPSEVFLGCNRGMKHATMPTFLNFLGVCGVRVLWVLFIFPLNPVVWMLYLCYPVSWCASTLLQGSYFFYLRRKVRKSDPAIEA